MLCGRHRHSDSMLFDLEQKIVDVCQQSWTALRCLERGPWEVQNLSTDVRHLSETLQLLLDGTGPSATVFQMATKEQTQELWTALDACQRNLMGIRSITHSLDELSPEERKQFVVDASLLEGGSHYLRAKIIGYSTTLKDLFVSFKLSSTSLNWPPSIDFLGQIQAELLTEGVQVAHLEPHRSEIKDYVRSLAVREDSYPNQSDRNDQEPPKSGSPITPMSSTTNSPVSGSLSPPRSQVTSLVDQFSTLFEPGALRCTTPSKSPAEGIRPKTPTTKPEISYISQRIPGFPARKDSMDPATVSFTSRFTAAMTSIPFSIKFSKVHGVRPPPQRSSSAVFRGLADEERATGD